MAGLPHVLAVGLLAAGLSGCALLDLLLGVPSFDPDETFPPFPFPTAAVIYTAGRATVELDGETLVLDRLLAGASAQTEFGSQVVWTNDEGWYMRYSGLPDMGFPAEVNTLTFDRIFDHQHWVILDPYRCVTTITQADATALTGTAACRGLSWSDWFAGFAAGGFSQPIPGQSPFDADITFEAH